MENKALAQIESEQKPSRVVSHHTYAQWIISMAGYQNVSQHHGDLNEVSLSDIICLVLIIASDFARHSI